MGSVSTRGPRSALPILARVVLAAFTDGAPLSRVQLTDITGLSRPVLNTVLDTLISRGDLVETSAAREGASRGRPSRYYQRTALAQPVVVIELDKDISTTATLVAADGTSLDVQSAPPWSSDWPTWSSGVKQAVVKMASGVTPRMAVLSVPFPVRPGRGMPPVHPLPPDERSAGDHVRPQPDWLLHDPRPAIESALGMPALVINDANLAALGESHSGAASSYRGVIHLVMRYGLGAGLIFDGAPLTGANGFAGELAHVQVRDNGHYCFCGGRGCWVTETTGPDLVMAVAAAIGHPLTLEEMLQLVELGQPLVHRFLRDYGALVGRAIAPVVTTIDPDAIIIDARLHSAAAPVLEGMTRELTHRCPPDLLERLHIAQGALEHAQYHGAVAAANAATGLNSI